MARKRRKSNSQRRRTGRSRNANRERGGAIPARTDGNVAETDAVVGEPAPVDLAATVSERRDEQVDSGPALPAAAPPKAKTSWPTRRKRSQLVELPVQELDHVRADLARIGVLSLGMVIVLVVLTFVLR